MQFSGCELKQTTIKACYCTWSSTCKKFAFFFASEQKINKSLNRDWSQNISWSFLPWQLCVVFGRTRLQSKTRHSCSSSKLFFFLF